MSLSTSICVSPFNLGPVEFLPQYVANFGGLENVTEAYVAKGVKSGATHFIAVVKHQCHQGRMRIL
jgi:hypothetical protein